MLLDKQKILILDIFFFKKYGFVIVKILDDKEHHVILHLPGMTVSVLKELSYLF